MKLLRKSNVLGKMLVAFMNPVKGDETTDINVARSILTNTDSLIFICEDVNDEIMFMSTCQQSDLDIRKLYAEIEKRLEKEKDVQIMKAFVVRVLSELMK